MVRYEFGYAHLNAKGAGNRLSFHAIYTPKFISLNNKCFHTLYHVQKLRIHWIILVQYLSTKYLRGAWLFSVYL